MDRSTGLIEFVDWQSVIFDSLLATEQQAENTNYNRVRKEIDVSSTMYSLKIILVKESNV